MSERARFARLAAVCLLLAATLARTPSAAMAEGDAFPPEAPSDSGAEPAPAAGQGEPPPADAAADPASPATSPPQPSTAAVPDEPAPASRPLGPGLAGEAHVPPVQPPVEVAGGEEPEPDVPPNNLRTIPTGEAAGILGKRVIGAAGEDIGMVVDVLIDTVGKPRAAVVDFGGFLGVGTRKIAVDWAFLQFRPGDRNAPVLLDVTGDAIRAAPEYRPSDPEASVVVSPPADEAADASDAPAEAGPGEPTAGTPAADGAPPADVQERAEPPPPSANAPQRPPLPEMKPPNGRPKVHPPAAGLPSADDLGPAPAPALPQTPPDARQ